MATMEKFNFCIACLVTDVRMYCLDRLSNHTICEIYSQFVENPVLTENQCLCFECMSSLRNFIEFKSKCRRAHTVLREIEIGAGVITKQIIQSIDRKLNKLESKLSQSTVLYFYTNDSKSNKLNCDNTEDRFYVQDFKTETVEIKVEKDVLEHEDILNEFCNEIVNNDETHNVFSDEVLSTSAAPKRKIKSVPARRAKRCLKSKPKIFIDDNIIENITKRKIQRVVKKLSNDTKPKSNVDVTENKIGDKEYKSGAADVKVDDNTENLDKLEVTINKSCNEIDNIDEAFSDSSDEFLSKLVKLKRKTKSVQEGTKAKRHKKSILKNHPVPSSVTDVEIKKNVGETKFKFYEDYLTVDKMTPEDARREMLSRKETNSYKMLEFKCEMCFKGFELKESFDKHMDRHDITAGEFKCDFCQLRFPLKDHLRKHLLNCHERKFTCILCPYACFATNQAKYHVNHHKGKTFTCEFCGKTFRKKNTMMAHRRVKHLNCADESVCEFCGNVFVAPVGISLHKKIVHPTAKNNKKGPECNECGVHFDSQAAWKRHLVTSSKHQVSNGCKTCGVTFPSADELKVHARGHAARRRGDGVKLPAACGLCDKWCTKMREYKLHMTTQHPETEEANRLLGAERNKPFVCEVCGKAFRSTYYLTYHARMHTGERPFACGACGKAFRLASQLTVHTNIHTKQRLYRCSMCARVFVQRSVLNKHMKIHLGIRPHKCSMCDKAFIHLCELKQHMRYTHEKVPWPKKKNKKATIEEQKHSSE